MSVSDQRAAPPVGAAPTARAALVPAPRRCHCATTDSLGEAGHARPRPRPGRRRGPEHEGRVAGRAAVRAPAALQLSGRLTGVTTPAALLRLQRSAGNATAAGLLVRRDDDDLSNRSITPAEVAGWSDAKLKKGIATPREVANTWTGTTWFIEGDLSNCFGSLDHPVMIKILAEKIHDNRFLRLMRNMLEAGYLEDWKWNATPSGCPQGGVISPVLSNIYLHKLDEYVETVLIPQYTQGTCRKRNPAYIRVRSRQIQPVEAFDSTSSVNNSEGFFQL